MSNVKKIVAAMGIAFATIGTASADNFDGFYVGGGVAFNKMTAKTASHYDEYWYGDTYSSVDETIGGDEDHDVGFNLNVGYGMSFGSFNLAIEAAYTSSYGEAEPYSYSESAWWGSYGESAKMELTGGKSVSILPGFKFSDDTMVYGRLGYVEAEGEFSWSDTDGWSSSVSRDFSGTIWGIGVKHAFTPSLVAVLEYQVTEFDSETLASGSYYSSANYYYSWHDDVEPASSGVTLGVQYTF